MGNCKHCGSPYDYAFSDDRGKFGPYGCQNEDCFGDDGRECIICEYNDHKDDMIECTCGEWVCDHCAIDGIFCSAECLKENEDDR